MGDLAGARRHWRRAAGANAAPETAAWATENLNDSKLRAGKRHGPWAFPIEYWIPRGVLEEMIQAVAGVRSENQVEQVVSRHIARHPHLELLADAILQRSDAKACKLLILLAPLVKSSVIFAALKRFALGERGSDDLRIQALLKLSEAGYLDGQVEIWRKGALLPVQLQSQEISDEPTQKLPPETRAASRAACEAIREDDGAEAERLLDEVLKFQPEDVSAQFNRDLAIRLQGREAESLEIIRRIHQENPDYLFARTHLADECITDGDLEQAKTLLGPITQKRRLHTSEYTAWCSACINLALAEGDLQNAKSLLESWEEISPNDHRIRIWKRRLRRRHGPLGRLFSKLDESIQRT